MSDIFEGNKYQKNEEILCASMGNFMSLECLYDLKMQVQQNPHQNSLLNKK